jgi:hypothetical protein
VKLLSFAERKRRHDALMKVGALKKAAQLRHNTRAFCSVHELALPKWAAASPTKGPRALPLATHEKRHALLVATGKRQAASKLRLDTRRRCINNGEPVPNWAASQAAPRAQREHKGAPARVATLPAPPPPFTPGKPLELPRALREWRAAAGDRAISIASDGTVTLLRGVYAGKVKASFPNLDAAAAAVEPPIAWVAVEVTRPSWAHAGRR